MKLFKDQRGFGLIPIILVAVLAIGVVGYVSYTAWQTSQDSKSSNQYNSSNDKSQEPGANNLNNDQVPEGWVKYRNDQFDISFYHPKDWVVGKNKHNHPTIVGYKASITTPDFKSRELEIGGITTSKGADISLEFYETDFKNLAEKHPYDSNNIYTKFFKDKKYEVSTIDGIEAWQYNYDYEGDAPYVTELIHNGNSYTISFNGETDDEVSAKYFDVYKKILNTVKFE